MDISQMPVVEKRSWRGRTRTSRGLDSGHVRQLSLRQEQRRRKVGLDEFGDAKEEEKVNEFIKESTEGVDKEWMMEKKMRSKGEVNWKKGDKLSLIKEDPTGPRAVSGGSNNQVDLVCNSPSHSCHKYRLNHVFHSFCIQHSQEESNAKGTKMVGLSVSSLEADDAKRGRGAKTLVSQTKEEDIISRRRTTFFWDVQRMVITSAPNLPNGQQRRPSMEFRKPEVMSKERAMAVLGLGVKKVKTISLIYRWI